MRGWSATCVGAGAAIFVAATAGFAAAPGPLSGDWLFGEGLAEPKESVVRVPQRCWSGGVDFHLSDVGGKLTGTARWIEPTRGVPPSSSHEESERLSGTVEGEHVLLTGKHRVVDMPLAYPSVPSGPEGTTVTTIRYDLHVDHQTGHLVGTRAGKPFWLARFKMAHADCGSPPP